MGMDHEVYGASSKSTFAVEHFVGLVFGPSCHKVTFDHQFITVSAERRLKNCRIYQIRIFVEMFLFFRSCNNKYPCNINFSINTVPYYAISVEVIFFMNLFSIVGLLVSFLGLSEPKLTIWKKFT
jgi:hypothetical protein